MTNALQHGISEKLAFDKATRTEEKIQENSGSLGDGLAICISGFPGAGKTVAAEEVYDVFVDYFEWDILSVDISEFASKHDVDSMEARSFVGQIDKELQLVDHNGAVFDGVESLEQVEYISKFFESVFILHIRSHHAARHNRLIEEARERGDDLEYLSRENLRKRDKKAGRRGLNAFERAQFFDMVAKNERLSESEFRSSVRYAAEELILDHKYGRR